MTMLSGQKTNRRAVEPKTVNWVVYDGGCWGLRQGGNNIIEYTLTIKSVPRHVYTCIVFQLLRPVTVWHPTCA